MITWLLAHRETIVLLAIAFLTGVLFAAWRQTRLEERRLDEQWIRDMRA